jgi:hypothetical protein
MLAQVLEIRRLGDKARNLINDIELLARSTISARQLFFHAGEHLQGTRILDFFGFDIVGRGRDARAVSAGLHGADWVYRGRVHVAHDGLAAFRGEAGLDWGSRMVETPCEEGVVYELLQGLVQCQG